MNDLIKREDAIKAIFSKPTCHGSDGSWYHSDDIRDAISSTPSADRPQGKWIDVNGDGSLWRCDQCKDTACCKGNFCPNCGARMKGAE